MSRLILARVVFIDPLLRKEPHIKEFKQMDYVSLLGEIHDFIKNPEVMSSVYEIKSINFFIQQGVRMISNSRL